MVIVACIPYLPNNIDVKKLMDYLKDNFNITTLTDDTIQASLDGIYVCKDGVPLREKTTEFLHKTTWQPLISGQKETDLVEYEKWIEHPTETLQWYFHPLTKITLNDVNEQKKLGHLDFGNNMGFGFEINHKKCSVLVLSDDQEVEKIEDWLYEFVGFDDEVLTD